MSLDNFAISSMFKYQLVRRVGLEPTTSAMSRRHSDQLSYPRNTINILYNK